MDEFKAEAGQTKGHCSRCLKLSGVTRRSRRRLLEHDRRQADEDAPRRGLLATMRADGRLQ